MSVADRTIGVHWLRCTYAESALDRLRERMRELWGEPEHVGGRWFYEFGERFGTCLLLWGGSNGGVCVDIPGGALDAMQEVDRGPLCYEFVQGARSTRADFYVDCRDKRGVGLIDAVYLGCESGRMVGARRWEPRFPREGQSFAGRSVNIGLPGDKGSGRYVRCYDKGLETGEAAAGTWERFEVEFSGDVAAEAVADVFRSPHGWEARAFARICGAVDFRDDPDEKNLTRRQRCQWWALFVGAGTPAPSVRKRERRTLEQYAEWIRRTVAPTAQAVGASFGLTWAEMLATVVKEPGRTRDYGRIRRLRSEFRELLGVESVPGVCHG